MEEKQKFYMVCCKVPMLAGTEDAAILQMFKGLKEGALDEHKDFEAKELDKEDEKIKVTHWG